ncbi:YbaK/EbsC family protein [Homoserinimonas sp. OAct 916]|uniref:YbaK/EbsC family protein n=1 Tax=Homoserinimonas sp. OAct 916 TaxID=2211450 RepID=UPI0013001B24|nr:YbaK/EbsC family protein [Homoserinimonas sp. OAct 916]
MTAGHLAGIDEAGERDRLLEFLAGAGIHATIVPYPAHTTVEEGKRLRGDLPGVFTKNLLLKDKKHALFFVTAHEDTDIDLKTLHTKIGARGRLGFATRDTMIDLLHVTPGTATPLALFNDAAGAVTLVVDHALEGVEQLNFHPMIHTESIGLTWEQFTTFASACGRVPVVVDPAGI